MKLAQPVGLLESDNSVLELSHNGEVIKWNISMLARVKNEDNLDRFAEINGYWAHLPQKRQDQIFEVYREIKDVMHLHDQDVVFERLQPLVAKLFELNPMEEISTWLAIYSRLRVPSNVMDVYDENDNSRNSRQGTYTTQQYLDLVTLSVTLRVMVPVWGDYVNFTDRIHGTIFKEFLAARLINTSVIYEAPVMERLREYINTFLPPETPKELIMEGLSSEDFPEWILARVLTRRLTVADLRGDDVKKSLMPFLHSFIEGMAKPKSNNFANMIKDKTLETSSSNDDSNLSILESYRPRQELTAGNIAALSVYTRDPVRMALRIMPDLPLELLHASLASVKALQMVPIMPVQLNLASWVLKKALPSRALPYLKKSDVITCLGVAQAVLWHRGYTELAGLVTAVAQSNEDMQFQQSVGSRGRVPNDMLEEIYKLYPYSERPTGKLKPGKDTKELNMVVLSIKEIDKLFSKNDWSLTLPPTWVEVLTKNRNNRNYSTPHEMRIRLASLIIAIAKRTF